METNVIKEYENQVKNTINKVDICVESDRSLIYN